MLLEVNATFCLNRLLRLNQCVQVEATLCSDARGAREGTEKWLNSTR